MTSRRSNPLSALNSPARCAIVASLAAVLLLAGASSAVAITRNTVLSRAQVRIDKPVPYSQTKYYAGYRTDCSGYVSMCWATGGSWNTRTFYKVTTPIRVADLRPGDALLKPGYHIRLFYGWVDDTRTSYIAYESAWGQVAGTRIHSIADDLAFGYKPVRYDKIQSSAASRNVLKNPTFDVWAREWSGAPELPVWWQVDGAWGQLVAHRRAVYRTAKNSLELRNHTGDPAQFTELSQEATITPGVRYRLHTYANTAQSPAGVRVGLAYLDSLGATLSETTTTGDRFGLDNASFKRMSMVTTAPAGAVRARVSVRLAGASVATTVGPTPVTTKVVVDDISLFRPYISMSIKASRTTAYSGRTAYLSGAISPTAAIGAPVTIYIQRPGKAWAKLATTKVYSTGSGGAAWKGKYTFTRSMPRGTYRFKASVAPIPDYLGNTSSTVSVRLR